MRKLLRLTLLILAIPLLLASIAIAWLCYTASGLQFALLQLNHVPNLEVQVRGVTGKLAGPLHVDHITLKHERVLIDIDQFDVDLTPALLLSGLLEIDRLQVGNIKATLKPRLTATPDKPIHFLPSFLRISVDELRLKRAEYVHTSGYTIVATPLNGNAELSRNRLRVRKLEVVTREFDARGEIIMDSAAVLSLQADLDAAYKLAKGPTLRGAIKTHGTITGVARQLDVAALLHQPHEAIVQGVLAFPDNGWSLRGTATADRVLLDAWWQKPSFSLAKLAGRFELSNAGMHYSGEVNIPEWSTAPLRFDADTHYAQRVFTLDRAVVSVPATGVHTRTQGTIALQTGSKPLIDIHSTWRQLRWPLHAGDDQAYFVSPQGELKLHGALPYQYEVQGEVRTPQWPLSQIQAAGELRSDVIELTSYKANTLQGSATGSATVQFNQPRRWQFELNGVNLDPAALQAAWPGSLNVKASGNGQGFDKQAQFDLRVQSLSGTLRKQSVKASGRLQRQGKRWSADAINAQWGRTHLTAQGVVGPMNNLRFSLQAPALQQLHPDVVGDLHLNGEVVGATDTPLLNVTAQSDTIEYGGWQAEALKLEARLDLTDRSDSHLELAATRLMQGDMGVEELLLTGDGRTNGHELTLRGKPIHSLVPKGYHIAVHTGAAYEDQRWHGVLDKLQVTDKKQETQLDLQQPSTWQVGSNQSYLQSLCVSVASGQSCGDANWQRDARGLTTWSVHANLKDLPLSITHAALAENARLQTKVNGQLNLSALNGAPWQGTATMQLTDASIRYRSVTGREEVLPITLGELYMNADARAVQTNADLHLGEQTVATLTAKLDRSAGTTQDGWPLSGVFALSSSDAKLIPVFVSEVDRASGTLAAALQLSGTTATPRMAGTMRLLQGELDFYQINLALRALEFDAQVDTDQLQFTAQTNAGEGLLNANGELSWRDAKLFGNVQLKGDRLLVADLPEYRVLASPDLRFDIDNKQVVVKGEVLIPEARLQPKDVVGAVQTSADARFKTDEVFDGNASNWTITSDVSIRLGEAVNFDGLGLQGRLAGAVSTHLRTGDTAVGSGELSVNNGHYEIYGQKLNIKRGRLLFENTPLDDPGLDIQAEREINEIKVGVNVRGVLRAPRLQFYSDPSMSQTQIVSYLLLGKPLDELQTGEATKVRSASSGLAMQGGGLIASQLGRRIGLEQVGVETDAKNQSALVLGKFLSPRLFVSYGISLTEAINTVKARYTLTDHWVVKTEAGEAKSADIEFKIER